MKFIKYTAILFVLLFFLIAVFYFWATGSQYSEKDYSAVNEFDIATDYEVKDTFSLMTYNIGYLSDMTNNLAVERPESLFSTSFANISSIFDSYEPDFIAFQEIDFNSDRSYNQNQYKDIAKACGYGFGAKAINWDKNHVPFPYLPIRLQFGKILSGQAVLSKATIHSTDRLVLPKPESNPFYYNAFYLDRLAQLVWTQVGDDSLLIINVHFEAWDAPSREIQAEMVLEIYKIYEDLHPIVLTGDFNCSPPYSINANDETTISTLANYPSISSAILKDSYLLNPEAYFTFNSSKPYEKLDYIFYNNQYLNCIESEVIHSDLKISDHLPVYAKFVLFK